MVLWVFPLDDSFSVPVVCLRFVSDVVDDPLEDSSSTELLDEDVASDEGSVVLTMSDE